MTQNAGIDDLIDGLIRDHLHKLGFTSTLESFDSENPKTPYSFSSRKDLVNSLYLNDEVKSNKNKGFFYHLFSFI